MLRWLVVAFNLAEGVQISHDCRRFKGAVFWALIIPLHRPTTMTSMTQDAHSGFLCWRCILGQHFRWCVQDCTTSCTMLRTKNSSRQKNSKDRISVYFTSWIFRDWLSSTMKLPWMCITTCSNTSVWYQNKATMRESVAFCKYVSYVSKGTP